MKKNILLSLLAVIAFSCSDDNDTTYRVSEDLTPYVDVFYAEAQERGVNLPKNLIADVCTCTNSTTSIYTSKDQNYFHYSSNSFSSDQADEIEFRVFMDLATLFLKKSAFNDEERKEVKSFLNVNMLNSYTQSQRDEFADELFQ